MEITARGLLFDLDGTLLDSWASIEQVFTAWCRQNDVDPAVMLPLLPGRPARSTIPQVLPDVSPEDLDRHIDWIDRAELDTTDGIVALPGAARLLDSIPRDRWAIVTSCKTPLALARLEAAGLPVPDTLIGLEMMGQPKPHPDGYRRGAATLGLAPETTVAFEDAPAGIRSALDAGARVIGIGAQTSGHDTTVTVEAPAAVDVTVDGRELRLTVTPLNA